MVLDFLMILKQKINEIVFFTKRCNICLSCSVVKEAAQLYNICSIKTLPPPNILQDSECKWCILLCKIGARKPRNSG